jgi:NAD(P)-dependent dehydrogenase (short-subunit alcohol dehydrogenase family)
MANELRFDGQVALVTGGGSGIGRAICEALAERGAKLVVNGNFRANGQGPEEDVAASIRAKGGGAVGVNGSVTDEDAAQRMVKAAIDSFGRLDIVVNNAGKTCIDHLVQSAPGEKFDEQIDIHVKGSLRVTRAAWPHLAASGAGRILNTGSGTALGGPGPNGYDGAYPVAKAALYGVTRQMAGEGAQYGIKANLVMPWAESPMTISALTGTPIGEWIFAKAGAHKVAASVLFLLHRDCPVTGQFISSCGGRVARIFFGQSRGYFNPELTPEDIRDHWDEVAGKPEGDKIVDAIEVRSMEHEFEVLQSFLGRVEM